MTPFSRLFAVEVRRALSRRAIRVLIGIALVGIALTGTIAYAASNDFDPTRLDPNIARLTDLWSAGGGDSVLASTLLFLVVGAMIGGATVTGAEWQHGTIVTVATWEVRRVRLLAARLLSATVLAALIGLALIVLLVLALVPTYLLRGTTAGADGDFWREVSLAVGRIACVTGFAAGIGAAVASLGRRTTVAVGAAFVYLAIIEGAVRSLWPARGRWLIGENATVFITAADLDGADFTRGVGTAALTLCGYAAVVMAAALLVFRRRDLAGSS